MEFQSVSASFGLKKILSSFNFLVLKSINDDGDNELFPLGFLVLTKHVELAYY